MTPIQLWRDHLQKMAEMLKQRMKDFGVFVSAVYILGELEFPDMIVLCSDLEDEQESRLSIIISDSNDATEKQISFKFERHLDDEEFSKFAESTFSAAILADDEARHKIARFFLFGELDTKFLLRHECLRVPAMA